MNSNNEIPFEIKQIQFQKELLRKFIDKLSSQPDTLSPLLNDEKNRIDREIRSLEKGKQSLENKIASLQEGLAQQQKEKNALDEKLIAIAPNNDLELMKTAEEEQIQEIEYQNLKHQMSDLNYATQKNHDACQAAKENLAQHTKAINNLNNGYITLERLPSLFKQIDLLTPALHSANHQALLENQALAENYRKLINCKENLATLRLQLVSLNKQAEIYQANITSYSAWLPISTTKLQARLHAAIEMERVFNEIYDLVKPKPEILIAEPTEIASEEGSSDYDSDSDEAAEHHTEAFNNTHQKSKERNQEEFFESKYSDDGRSNTGENKTTDWYHTQNQHSTSLTYSNNNSSVVYDSKLEIIIDDPNNDQKDEQNEAEIPSYPVFQDGPALTDSEAKDFNEILTTVEKLSDELFNKVSSLHENEDTFSDAVDMLPLELMNVNSKLMALEEEISALNQEKIEQKQLEQKQLDQQQPDLAHTNEETSIKNMTAVITDDDAKLDGFTVITKIDIDKVISDKQAALESVKQELVTLTTIIEENKIKLDDVRSQLKVYLPLQKACSTLFSILILAYSNKLKRAIANISKPILETLPNQGDIHHNPMLLNWLVAAKLTLEKFTASINQELKDYHHRYEEHDKRIKEMRAAEAQKKLDAEAELARQNAEAKQREQQARALTKAKRLARSKIAPAALSKPEEILLPNEQPAPNPLQPRSFFRCYMGTFSGLVVGAALGLLGLATAMKFSPLLITLMAAHLLKSAVLAMASFISAPAIIGGTVGNIFIDKPSNTLFKQYQVRATNYLPTRTVLFQPAAANSKIVDHSSTLYTTKRIGTTIILQHTFDTGKEVIQEISIPTTFISVRQSKSSTSSIPTGLSFLQNTNRLEDEGKQQDSPRSVSTPATTQAQQ